jgi:Uma2 family endonuclease
MSTALAFPPTARPKPSVPTPTQSHPTERLLTAADLAAFPDELPSGPVKYELHDGRLVVMPPPGYDHARRQNKIGRFLDTEAEERGLGEACCEVAIVLRRNPDRVVGADAAFVLARSLPARRTREGYLETIPEIVVEVRSRNDWTPEVIAKVQEYFDAGVLLVWVIDPVARTVAAHRPDGSVTVARESDTLTCDLLPGFVVPVTKLFGGVIPDPTVANPTNPPAS